jgi:hypothetical protein
MHAFWLNDSTWKGPTMRRFILSVAASILFLGGSQSAEAGLIANGDFETGNLTGWTKNGNIFPFHSFDGFLPNGGNVFAALGDAFSLGTLSQTINDTAGEHYALSLHLGSDGETPNEFKIEWNGKTLYDQTNLPDTRSNVSQYDLLSFPVVGTGSDTLTLFERNDRGSLALDDVSLDAVPDSAAPEPSTLVMACVALGAFAARRVRRVRG